jgi:hypothetical protein
MRRVGLSGGIAITIIVAAYALDAWRSLPAYFYLLWPGFAVAGLLDRLAAISAFDSSGDLSSAGIIVAFVANFLFWFFVVWLTAYLAARYGRLAPSSQARRG